MTTTDPKLIERIARAMKRCQPTYDGSVWMDPSEAQLHHMIKAILPITAAAINEAAHQWQDIATAPRDGTPLLVIDMQVDEPMAVLVHWARHDAWGDEPAWLVGHNCDWPPRYRRVPREMAQAACNGIMPNPTRWMPLPSPPAIEAKESQHG